ncbi:HEAT repeat domain-containing protein [Spirochaetia bacterium 38H-sp]|uniref:HEAT repeat domain-containing protein n=1 Tax=Rarispira pelagica TaxID=3141764 RepID=A0ABU9UAW3_9SPIR
MRIKKITVFILLILIDIFYVFSQEENIKSIIEERIEILQFGIEQEILDVLDKIESQPESAYDTVLPDIFSQTKSKSIKEKIISYYKNQKSNKLIESIKKELDTYDDVYDQYGSSYLVNIIDYLESIKSQEAVAYIESFFELEENDLSTKLIEYIGELKLTYFLEKIRSLSEDSSVAEQVRLEAIRTLGKLGDNAAIDTLMELMDSDEKSVKRAACQALGELGEENSLPVIIKAMQDSDPYLRVEAVKALKNFAGEEVNQALFDAFRDNFWKVRVTACSVVSGKPDSYNKILPILIYRAKNDPELTVKKAAIKALADINTGQSKNALKEMIADKKTSDAIKLSVYTVLIDKDINLIKDEIQELLREEWEKDKSVLLEKVAKEISMQKASWLAPIFEKMLDHKNFVLKLYGLQGIRINRFSQYRERIQQIFDTEKNITIKKYAKAALDAF